MVYVAITLAFIALGAFVVSFMLEEGRGFARLVGAGTLLLTLVTFGMSAAVTVQPGHVGVPILFGSVQADSLGEGFHLVNPFVSVDEMSIQTQTVTMTGDTALHAMSSDQLSMTLDISVLYHLNPAQAPGVRRYMPTYEETVVIPSIRTAIRDAVREFEAVDAVSTSRDELANEMVELVRARIANAFDQRELAELSVQIDDVQLRNIQLPDEIQESIQNVQRERQLANQREQAIQTATQEAERVRIEANGQSAVAVIEAQRDAQARLIRASAESEANDLLNQSLTPQLLRLRAIQATQAITTNRNTRTVILGSGNQQTPLIMNMGQE